MILWKTFLEKRDSGKKENRKNGFENMRLANIECSVEEINRFEIFAKMNETFTGQAFFSKKMAYMYLNFVVFVNLLTIYEFHPFIFS